MEKMLLLLTMERVQLVGGTKRQGMVSEFASGKINSMKVSGETIKLSKENNI